MNQVTETSELTYQLPRERKKVNPKEQRNKKLRGLRNRTVVW
jgi:hypothetical protein